MDEQLRNKLIKVAGEKISNEDVSHDFQHATRVLSNAESIAGVEGGDLDVVVPSALFHDVIVYPKNEADAHGSNRESAQIAEIILKDFTDFTNKKISKVKTCILECSFSKGVVPDLLESKILQDADGLEATGAISIMRTYSSAGQMKSSFYNPEDPFCDHREPDGIKFALDLFFERLLKVGERMHTATAKMMAERRTDFLRVFLQEFKLELEGK